MVGPRGALSGPAAVQRSHSRYKFVELFEFSASGDAHGGGQCSQNVARHTKHTIFWRLGIAKKHQEQTVLTMNINESSYWGPRGSFLGRELDNIRGWVRQSGKLIGGWWSNHLGCWVVVLLPDCVYSIFSSICLICLCPSSILCVYLPIYQSFTSIYSIFWSIFSSICVPIHVYQSFVFRPFYQSFVFYTLLSFTFYFFYYCLTVLSCTFYCFIIV